MNGTDLDTEEVEQRYEKLVANVGPRIEDVFRRIPAVLHKRDTMQHKYIGLLRLVNEAAKIIDPYTPCKKGCGHCCAMSVSVPEYEAKRISAHIGKPYVQPDREKHEADLLELLRRRDNGEDMDALMDEVKEKEGRKYLRVPCVFRGPNMECTIYPVRPMACRTYHTIAPSNEPCQLGMAGQRAKEVPAVNLNNFHLAHAIVAGPDCAVADIREWFPEGRGK